MNKAPSLTVDRLREALAYDKNSGVFRWKDTGDNRKPAAGTVAGSKAPDSYVMITLDGRRYCAQVLAWLYVTGQWPALKIDHRDLRRDNNRFANLREATPAQNNVNRRVQSNSLSGFKGVNHHRHRNLKRPYQAIIKVSGKKKSLGYFASPEEAQSAYFAESTRVYGEFARIS